jgi:glycosyltransferase involved in cell wall biosynthesis
MFSSTIIPTINRHTLSRAVQSVLDQDFTQDDFEVIVVNDSGKVLPDAEWQRSPRVRVINTDHRERSVARNTGAALARGKYFHFLDDDDVLLPGALNAFWEQDQKGDDIWLYGGYQTTDNDGNVLEELTPGVQGNIFGLLIAGEGIPLQVSLLRASAFFQSGGYDPQLSACEDRDVCRRLALLGNVAYVPYIMAQIRIGEAGSSTDWSNLIPNDQWGREKVMHLSNALERARISSANSSYWRGRVCRAYFASMVWNFQKRYLFVAASRLFAGVSLIGLHFLSTRYWRGLREKVK